MQNYYDVYLDGRSTMFSIAAATPEAALAQAVASFALKNKKVEVRLSRCQKIPDVAS